MTRVMAFLPNPSFYGIKNFINNCSFFKEVIIKSIKYTACLFK